MVETVDLVNISGEIVVRGIPRHKIDRYPDLYLQIVVVVVFNPQGEIIIHRRSEMKEVNPGDIDHVCGAVISGESPTEAARRETCEELGVSLRRVSLVDQGVNQYGRYRYLLVGSTDQEPCRNLIDGREVSWVGADHPEALIAKQESGLLTFTEGFFDDLRTVQTWVFGGRQSTAENPGDGVGASRF